MTRIFHAAWVALMVLVPLFGFWLASSLAAYKNASQWLALLVGLALFPLVPVGWEMFYAWRRSRRDSPAKPILTRLDRLVLRTLLVNGVFLGIMLWQAPATSFRALSVRGDWILDGHDGPIASSVRGVLLGLADTFDKRWHHASDEFGTSDKPPDPTDHHEPPPPPPPDPTAAKPPADPNGWPLAPEADPIVTAMPADAQTSPASVGKYLATQIADKRKLAKAVHDYIVLRLHYDEATFSHRGEPGAVRPSQQAVDVFAAKTGVCEGYARLMVAIGEAAGLEVAFITGYIRDAHRGVEAGNATTDEGVKAALEGYLHAWNAVKIDGGWLLVDATWDDPVSEDGAQTLSSTYLFTPPRLFAFDHLPEESAWQLLDKPLGAGEFARQPLLSSFIGTLGVTLDDPTRSQITVDDGEATVIFDNPYHASLMADLETRQSCKREEQGTKTKLVCEVPAGKHEIRLYGARDRHAHHLDYIGSILVNSR